MNRGRGANRGAAGGVTLLELTVVVAIIAILSAIAVPPIMSTLGGFKLRSSAASLAALIQETRMRAVRDDKFYTMRAASDGGAAVYYLDLDENSILRGGEELVQVAYGVQVIPETGAPAPLPASGYTQDAADPISFNARGTPCLASGSAPTSCRTLVAGAQIGFVYYLARQPFFGPVAYKAVSVTPSGRVRIWSYSGGSWQ